MKKLLRINGSPRKESSISRQMADLVQARLTENGRGELVNTRDVYYDDLIKLGNEDQVNAYFIAPEEQTAAQKAAVANSNELAIEFTQADEYLFSIPMYNFTVSAGIKAYIDLISRAGITFQYGENGPQGLLKNKKAYVVLVTGGVPIGSEYDFTKPYIKFFLGFLGITDVEFVEVVGTSSDQEKAVAGGKVAINDLVIA